MTTYRVHQVPPLDDEAVSEVWVREVTDRREREIHGVDALRQRDGTWPWQVDVWVMGCVRDVPLEAKLRLGIAAALRGVPGVSAVEEGDREFWIVRGDPEGVALVRAVATVVDALAEEVRVYLRSRPVD